MMTFITQNKLLFIVALLLVGGGVYYFLFAGASTPAPLLSSDSGGSGAESQQLLVILGSLKTIELNDAIFSDPVFLSLSDFSVALPLEPAGRPFPFAPFTGSLTPATSTANIPLPTH